MPHHITHTHYTCIFIQAIHTERHTSITVSFIPFFTPLHKELTTIKKKYILPWRKVGTLTKLHSAFHSRIQTAADAKTGSADTHTTDIESSTLTFCFRQIWLWHVEHGFHWKSCKCALCRIHLWLQGERKPLRSYVDSFDQCTFASLNNKHFLGIQRATQCFSISKIIGS